MCKKKTSELEYKIALSFNPEQYSNIEIEYLNERLLDQIKWYDKKAIENQKNYKNLSVVSFIISATIPILAFLGENLAVKIITAAAGAAVSVITYIININTYKDLWIQYRMNCEMLKSEAIKFKNKIPPYDSEDAFELLVNNSEQYFTKEFSKWQNVTNQSSTGS